MMRLLKIAFFNLWDFVNVNREQILVDWFGFGDWELFWRFKFPKMAET